MLIVLNLGAFFLGGTDATPDTSLEEVNTILAESLQHPEEAALTTLVIHDSSDDEE